MAVMQIAAAAGVVGAGEDTPSSALNVVTCWAVEASTEIYM